MFFIFSKKKFLMKPHNERLLAKYRTNKKMKFLLITTNLELIKNALIPLHFIFKEVDSFIILYRFATLRSYDKLRFDLKWKIPKLNIQTVLVPAKTIQPLLRIFFLFKIQFHFPAIMRRGRVVTRLETLQLIRNTYSLLRLQIFQKIFINI